MADARHLWSDSEPGVDTVEICVEHHEGQCREFVIWIQCDNRKLGENGSLPLLREDPLISQTCAMEENASHYLRRET